MSDLDQIPDQIAPQMPQASQADSASQPLVSVVVPTHNRPEMAASAVASALGQTHRNLEVVVVDDGSTPPLEAAVLGDDPRVRVVRLDPNRGVAAARNAGMEAARGEWITYCDDDDTFLPRAVESLLAAALASDLPPPVGVIGALEVIDSQGRHVETRLPPTYERGKAFSLEPLPPGRSFFSKQSLLIRLEVLRSIGGWDAEFKTRGTSEMFLRLNAVCSILGIDEVVYRQLEHPGPRLSRDPEWRQIAFYRLLDKHRPLFKSRPRETADFLLQHARMSLRERQYGATAGAILRAAATSPALVAGRLPRWLAEAVGLRSAPWNG